MFHQYMSKAQAKIAPLSSDELKELMNDDEKLEEYVNEVVCIQISVIFETIRMKNEI